MFKRFYVKVPEGTMKLYYESEEECLSHFPNAEISLCEETDFLDYVHKIRDLSSDVLVDYQGRLVWVIETKFGRVFYRQYFDGEDPIDGCQYKMIDHRVKESHLWNLSTPKEFYELFENVLSDSKCEFVSPKEAKSKKAKRLFDKQGYRYFIDSEGYYYIINKQYLPTKKHNEPYNKYHNTDAVLVKYGTGVKDKLEWFDGIADFLEYFDEYQKNWNPVMGTLRYAIKRSAKTLRDLNDIKSVLCIGKCPDIRTENNTSRLWAYGARNCVSNWWDIIPIIDNLVNYMEENTDD